MNKEKIKLAVEALSGLSYGEFADIFNELSRQYHVTKKELTPEEVSSTIERVSKRWD